MKILYGVQGTGNGHLTRARVIATELAKLNADVDYVFSGRPKEDFFGMEVFGNFKCLQGLTFITKNGKIDHLATLRKNNLFRFFRDIRALNVEKYDLVLCDFEPVTAWAAKLAGKKSIGIGHQYAFGPNTPKRGDDFMSTTIMKWFAPVSMGLGLHWHPYAENVLPPVIDTNLTPCNVDSDKILVYLPFENQDYITTCLKQISSKTFYQYSSELVDDCDGNVHRRKASLDGFKADLKSASAVISNSGFELLSECIHLGKPIITKPLIGQFEQLSNALAITDLGYGNELDEITAEKIQSAITNLSSNSAAPYPDVAAAIAEAIVNNAIDATTLHHKLWQTYPLPSQS